MLSLTALLSLTTLRRMTSSETSKDLPSQDGRTYIITGANSGIGLAAARALGAAGARVVLAVRSVDKGNTAATTIHGDREVRRRDVADLSSIRAFADEWEATSTCSSTTPA